MDAVLTLAVGLGALGVFALMIPESAGIPVPSELILILAGVAVADGHMNLWVAVLAGTAGNVVGSVLLYELGRRLRRRELGPRARKGLARSERLFERHGHRAVLIGRLIPLVRSFISLPAGTAHVPLVPFIALTAAGCAIWSLAFVTLGASAGTYAARLGASVGPYAGAAVLLALAATALRRSRTLRHAS